MGCRDYTTTEEVIEQKDQRINHYARMLCTAMRHIHYGDPISMEIELWWRQHDESDHKSRNPVARAY